MQYSSIIVQSEIRNLLVDSESIDENLLCGICQELVVQPKECEECQHLFCEQCITDWSKKNSKCPYKCQAQIIKLKEPHRFVKNTISHIQIKCANIDCDKITEIGLLDNHVKECQHTKIICQFQGCGLMIKKLDQQKHNQECEYRLQKCEKCETEYKINQQHDCIKYLKNLILQQGEAIKKLQDLVLQSQNIQQMQSQQIQELKNAQKQQKPQCEQGHYLIWTAPKYSMRCGKCLFKNQIIRYHCHTCNLDFCQACKKPVFNLQKCPGNHDLNFEKDAGQGISCDFCGQKPCKKNEPVWSDRACDFDVCNTCYIKLSQQ